MLRLLVALLPTLCSAMRSRRDLVIENLALRQQLRVALFYLMQCSGHAPPKRPTDVARGRPYRLRAPSHLRAAVSQLP